MKKYILFLFSLVLSFSLVNCGGGGGGGDDDSPVINKNSLAVSNSSLTFDAAAGQQTVNVTANCDWKVSCSASWLTINPMSGNANATLTLSAQENTITTREATVTVTGGGFTRTISVTQKGAEEKLSVSPQTLSFEYKESYHNYKNLVHFYYYRKTHVYDVLLLLNNNFLNYYGNYY